MTTALDGYLFVISLFSADPLPRSSVNEGVIWIWEWFPLASSPWNIFEPIRTARAPIVEVTSAGRSLFSKIHGHSALVGRFDRHTEACCDLHTGGGGRESEREEKGRGREQGQKHKNFETKQNFKYNGLAPPPEIHRE